MAKKREPFQKKTRTREHVIADLAVNHTERQGLLCGYSLERIVHDYGLDLILFTYNQAGELDDGSIFLQVKATEKVRVLQNSPHVPFRVSRAELRTWLGRLMPVILIVYDVKADIAYWLYVPNYFAHLPGFNLFTVGQTVTLHIPRSQVVTPTVVREFAACRDRILGQIEGTIDHA